MHQLTASLPATGELSTPVAWVLVAGLVSSRRVNCGHQFWKVDHLPVQLWPDPWRGLLSAALPPQALSCGCLPDHCYCAWLPAQLRGLPCCARCSGATLCLVTSDLVSPRAIISAGIF